MWEEFKKFALKGNVVDLAIGVIIGAAFGKIVESLVGDIIMPIFGAIGGLDFSNYFLKLSSAVTATSLADAKKQGAVLAYGNFITVAINFMIIAVGAVRRHQDDQPHQEEGRRKARGRRGSPEGAGTADRDPRSARQEAVAPTSQSRHCGART